MSPMEHKYESLAQSKSASLSFKFTTAILSPCRKLPNAMYPSEEPKFRNVLIKNGSPAKTLAIAFDNPPGPKLVIDNTFELM